jgi:hypothetical protein
MVWTINLDCIHKNTLSPEVRGRCIPFRGDGWVSRPQVSMPWDGRARASAVLGGRPGGLHPG